MAKAKAFEKDWKENFTRGISTREKFQKDRNLIKSFQTCTKIKHSGYKCGPKYLNLNELILLHALIEHLMKLYLSAKKLSKYKFYIYFVCVGINHQKREIKRKIGSKTFL